MTEREGYTPYGVIPYRRQAADAIQCYALIPYTPDGVIPYTACALMIYSPVGLMIYNPCGIDDIHTFGVIWLKSVEIFIGLCYNKIMYTI